MASREGIDIAINESGSKEVQRSIKRLADSVEELSPQLAKSLRGRALRVGINTDKMVDRVAAATLKTVVKSTPRDTGRARANWQVSISAGPPNISAMEDSFDFEGNATILKGVEFLRGSKRIPGQTVWISNDLDYIWALNNGWSQQAPAGFVSLAIQSGAHEASKAKLLEKK